MFEARISSAQGWAPVDCRCPAGRALFGSEEKARAAIDLHIQNCGSANRVQLVLPFATEAQGW